MQKIWDKQIQFPQIYGLFSNILTFPHIICADGGYKVS